MAKIDFKVIIDIMEKTNAMKKIDNATPFSFFGIGLIAFAWLAFFLAFTGLFQSWLIIAIASGLFLVFARWSFTQYKKIRLSPDFSLVIIISLLAILIFSYFTVPTIFTGRDQGSLSSAAISLVQNHSLTSSFPAEKEFFKIYGPGQALNFPGFYYTKNGDLISQFPLGYIAYLAAFYALFGLGGLIVANAFSFFLFLISFYAVAKNYLESKPALMAFALVLTSFVFSWFFKFTLSENLALALLWFGIAQFLLFWKEESRLSLFAFMFSFGLLLFVRIEAFAFLAVALALLFFKYKKNKQKLKKLVLSREIIFVIALIIVAFLSSLYSSSAFYMTLAKGILNSFHFSKNDPTEASPYPLAGTFYLFRVFSVYAVLTYILLALAALFYFLRKRNFEKLLPYLIILPIFIYLINPSISLDHPWMLRRYVFAIIPLSILYSIIFLKDILKKDRFFYIFSLFLLLTNLIIFLPYLRLRENPTLLPQIEKLSHTFENNDLVLIDREAAGSPWAMMAGPLDLLFKKQAVYFFNPDDFGKIDLTKFGKIYLVIPDDNIAAYKASGLLNNFITVKSYSFENFNLSETDKSRVEHYKNPVILPPYLKNYIYGKIYLLKQ